RRVGYATGARTGGSSVRAPPAQVRPPHDVWTTPAHGGDETPRRHRRAGARAPHHPASLMISRKHRGARALSVVAHDVLIRASPASFRAEYANEMRWAFSHLCADAIASRGLAGLLEVWIDTLVDFPASVIATHRE